MNHPSISEHSSDTNIDADDHVTEEQPLTDERLAAVSRRYTHDRVVGRVKAECSGGKTVGDEVDPEELDRDERLGHAEEHGEEDRDDLANI